MSIRVPVQPLALALLLAGTPLLASTPRPEPADGVDRILAERRDETEPTTSLVDQLATAPLPELVEVLTRGTFESSDEAGGVAHLSLRPAERAAVVAAVGEIPLRELRAYFVELRKTDYAEGQQLAALQVLAAHGTAGDLLTLAAWSHPAGEGQRVARSVPPAVAAAMADLLGREPGAWSSFSQFYRSLHLSAVRSVLTRLGEEGSEHALASLVDVLGSVSRADPLVLGEVTHVAGLVPHPIDPRLRSRVRARLSSSDDLVLTETIQALAALEDNEALPELIALLEHPVENVRLRAHEALKSMTGEPFSRDMARWKGWYREATDWWKKEGPRELQRATSGPPARASRAILVLARRQLYRHEIAESLAQALDRREPEIVAMACAALGSLGSDVAVGPLIEALDHELEDIRGAVHTALVQITGEDRGPSSRDWRLPRAR